MHTPSTFLHTVDEVLTEKQTTTPPPLGKERKVTSVKNCETRAGAKGLLLLFTGVAVRVGNPPAALCDAVRPLPTSTALQQPAPAPHAPARPRTTPPSL